MLVCENWKDYALLDASDGERLERWGRYILIRPDPQVLWKGWRNHPAWGHPDAVYTRSGGGGAWEKSSLPEKWSIRYGSLTFNARPMGFKHLGLFPEQAANWDRIMSMIKAAKDKNPAGQVKVLNLFAYTGGATLAAAAAGASVCHVDAAKGMVSLARENASSSGLGEAPIRYIVDDCMKFIEREERRGNTYDGIIMDPPSYGRGPNGEVWKLEDGASALVESAAKLLSPDALFFIVNSYSAGLAPSAMGYMLSLAIQGKRGGSVSSDEIGIRVSQTGAVLPCGAVSIWQSATSE